MNEERMKVLEMLSEGKLSAEEASRLLDALGAAQSPEPEVEVLTVQKNPKPRWFRVEVTKNGESKVNVRIPLLLLKAGMKLKAMLPDHVQTKVDAELEEKGFSFRFEDLDKQDLDEMLQALTESAIEVDGDDGEHVRIYCA